MATYHDSSSIFDKTTIVELFLERFTILIPATHEILGLEAYGNKKDFAKKAKVSRQHLYRLFGKDANPTIDTLSPGLASLGLKLTLTE